MNLLKKRIAATDAKLDEMKATRKAAQKASRQAYKQTKADRERRVMLVGEAVLRRVDRGEWNEAEFRQMMDEALPGPLTGRCSIWGDLTAANFIHRRSMAQGTCRRSPARIY
ncbi:hypothetical protein [Paraburkholderia sp. Cpub6]|uniref:hypothetical protein n=1 Tax=Paraburkholderia sp. Cpub6 TaxID=2723094 RepID=UPI0016121AEB|nr:hypothetical protein [Paraburkholderia sp. Cpub6]MBB5457759.1 hypothetical protein [Paraburkholderia sp. Cpub6]